jgi:hypothetical protein
MQNQVIDLWFGDHANGIPLKIKTGQVGTAFLMLPQDTQTFVAAGEWVADCRRGNEPGKSFIDSSVYSVHATLSTGIVAENRCGKTSEQPVPGVFTFYVRPMHWWEKIRE